MRKNLIIGGASGYSWDQLKYWVNSLKKIDFDFNSVDIVLVMTDFTHETAEKLTQKGINVYAYGKQNEQGFYSDKKLAPHVARFFHLWNFLNKNQDEYESVVVTDTRDVIFQTDPFRYLHTEVPLHSEIVVSSEGLKYKDEPWNSNNYQNCFGGFFFNDIAEKEIMNVGVIAGDCRYVSDLLLMIFQMSMNRPIPVVDQAVYNFLLNTKTYSDVSFVASPSSHWAAQLGTTKYAVQAGSGDLGAICKQNHNLLERYMNVYEYDHPIISNYLVTAPDGIEYSVVHQWDRIPELKSAVEQYYGED